MPLATDPGRCARPQVAAARAEQAGAERKEAQLDLQIAILMAVMQGTGSTRHLRGEGDAAQTAAGAGNYRAAIAVQMHGEASCYRISAIWPVWPQCWASVSPFFFHPKIHGLPKIEGHQ